MDVLERGKLQFKTDDMGTLQIEWDKVASVAAKAQFDWTTSGAGATSARWSRAARRRSAAADTSSSSNGSE